jgi:hypothetical protein
MLPIKSEYIDPNTIAKKIKANNNKRFAMNVSIQSPRTALSLSYKSKFVLKRFGVILAGTVEIMGLLRSLAIPPNKADEICARRTATNAAPYFPLRFSLEFLFIKARLN